MDECLGEYCFKEDVVLEVMGICLLAAIFVAIQGLEIPRRLVGREISDHLESQVLSLIYCN